MTVEMDYSKKQVNRAGKLLRNLGLARTADDTASLEGFDTDDLHNAVNVVEWWRSIHARPLVRVNANLRYYIRKAGANPEVTQRLKRFGTITHKLQREPTMALSSMEDIGGVRAISRAKSRSWRSAKCLTRQTAGGFVAAASTSKEEIQGRRKTAIGLCTWWWTIYAATRRYFPAPPGEAQGQ
jgi:hypothetical protein